MALFREVKCLLYAGVKTSYGTSDTLNRAYENSPAQQSCFVFHIKKKVQSNFPFKIFQHSLSVSSMHRPPFIIKFETKSVLNASIEISAPVYRQLKFEPNIVFRGRLWISPLAGAQRSGFELAEPLLTTARVRSYYWILSGASRVRRTLLMQKGGFMFNQLS